MQVYRHLYYTSRKLNAYLAEHSQALNKELLDNSGTFGTYQRQSSIEKRNFHFLKLR